MGLRVRKQDLSAFLSPTSFIGCEKYLAQINFLLFESQSMKRESFAPLRVG